MPSYYLSYVEVNNNHSAVMLSEQQEPGGPAKIIREIGFRYAERISAEMAYFGTWTGKLDSEMLASQAMYSSKKVKHRTFEISPAEAKKFHQIIDRDQKLNRTIVDGKAVSGPAYKKLSFNCKTYAMGLLKEMGVLDALNLKNYLVQIPGTTNGHLKPVKKSDLSCPVKDQFLLEAREALTPMIRDLTRLNRYLDQNAKNQHFGQQLQKALQAAQDLQKSIHKSGFDNDPVYKAYNELQSSLALLSEHGHQKNLNFLKKYTQQDFRARMDSIFNYNAALNVTLAQLPSLTQQYKNNEIEFQWITTPRLSHRIHLKNFNDIEKVIYLEKVKGSEAEDGLNQLIALINKKLAHPEKLGEAFALDLFFLKNTLDKAKENVHASNLIFLKSLKNPKADVANACLKQDQRINDILKVLGSKISTYQPQAPAQTNPLLRFIERVLQFFNRDHFDLGDSLKAILHQKVNRISKKHARFCKRTNFFLKFKKQPHLDPEQAQQPMQDVPKKEAPLVEPKPRSEVSFKRR